MIAAVVAAAALGLTVGFSPQEATAVVYTASPADPAAARMEATLRRAIPDVETFFGAGFPEPVRFTLARDRAAFDATFPAAWNMGASQCWMVGVGVADFLVMLSPSVWETQACEHRAAPDHEREILLHELVHVYHGQHNPTRDFVGAEDAAWFTEGVAVLASGQLTDARMAAVRDAMAGGQPPASLQEFWTGRLRYGLAGSLVRYIEVTQGRERLRDLMSARNSAEILERLNTDEATLIRDWTAWLSR